jgi:hypothetical protein
MKRIPVRSSNISNVGYDIKNQVLELEFSNGQVYHYLEVGQDIVLGFIFSESLGQYFAKNIKSNYKYVKGEYNG